VLALGPENVTVHTLALKKGSRLMEEGGALPSGEETARMVDLSLEALEGATLVSIHQNSYPQSRYHGTQVFFAPTEGSQQLAEAIQQGVQGTLQLENRRAAKQIAGNVYLMNHVDNRAVLVECGFLSNPEEERALRDPEYQTRMAAVLAWVCLMDTGAVPS